MPKGCILLACHREVVTSTQLKPCSITQVSTLFSKKTLLTKQLSKTTENCMQRSPELRPKFVALYVV